MPDGEAGLVDPAHFQRNLDALRTVDAALADRLAATAVPDGAELTRGRDGSPTYRLRGADGRWHWLGGSSTPTVSAPAMLSRFDAGTGNVMLYGIGHGQEAIVLLDRLPPHRGVVVIETDVSALAMALRLRDFAAALAARRLVLLPAEPGNEQAALSAFLANHEGFNCPERLVLWPWLSQADAGRLQGFVQRCAVEAAQRRSEALHVIRAESDPRPPAALVEKPRLAVVSVIALPHVWGWADDVVRAASESRWTACSFVARGPDDCHRLCLARALKTFAPQWVVALGTGRGDVEPAVPGGVPIATWIDGTTARLHGIPPSGGPADVAVCTSELLRERLARAGWPADRLAVVAHGAFAAESITPWASRERDAVLMADLVALDPQAAGITLNTHRVLWQECAKQIAAEIDSYTRERAEAVLRATETRLRIPVGDPEARAELAGLIADALGPTVVAIEIARRLAASGVSIDVWGQGWGAYATGRLRHGGAIPRDDDLHVTLLSTKLYVDASTDAEVHRRTVLAAAAGSLVARRQHPSDDRPGGIRTLLAAGKEYVSFRSPRDLEPHVRKQLGGTGGGEAMAATAVERISREHGVAGRLDVIRSIAAAAIGRGR